MSEYTTEFLEKIRAHSSFYAWADEKKVNLTNDLVDTILDMLDPDDSKDMADLYWLVSNHFILVSDSCGRFKIRTRVQALERDLRNHEPFSQEILNKYKHFALMFSVGLINAENAENPHLVQLMIDMDMTRYVPTSEQNLNKILDKMDTVDPEFCSSYTYPMWEHEFACLFRSTMSTDCPHTLYQRAFKFVPIKEELNDLKSAIEEHGEHFRLYLRCAIRIQYSLGLPVLNISYTREDLISLFHQALEDLDGWKQKIKAINQRNLQNLLDDARTFGREEITVANTTNLIFDEVDEYAPIDIYRVITPENKLFQFTHNELESILEDGLNPYTREELSEITLTNMKITFNSRKGFKVMPVAEMIQALIHPSQTLTEFVMGEYQKLQDQIQLSFSEMFEGLIPHVVDDDEVSD